MEEKNICFHMNFRIFSISVKNVIEMLVEKALNFHITSGYYVLTIFIEYGSSFHLLVFSFIYFLRVS
jgi:hypothetical protein